MPVTAYNELEYGEFRKLFKPERTPDHIAATLFHTGDHWQNAKGYIGPRPYMKDMQYFATMNEIKEAFVTENAIFECNDRHLTGVLGREARWNFLIPTKEEVEADTAPQSVIDANDAATRWWNDNNAIDIYGQAIVRCLNEDRAVLRYYIPEGFLNDEGEYTGDTSTLFGSMEGISLELCDNEAAGVFYDKRTKQKIGVFFFKVEGKDWVEVCYVDRETKETVIVQIPAEKNAEPKEVRYNLGGRLTMYEIRRKALATAQVQSCQKALNLSDTMMMRNVNQAGSLERVFMNAEQPSEITEIPDSTVPGGVKRIKKAIPYRTGAGVSMFLQGSLIYNDQGEIVGRANPNVSYRNPVDVKTFVDTCDKFYRSILSQYQQRMYLLASDGNVGDESRENAKKEFYASLKLSKRSLDPAGRWGLETLYFMAMDLKEETPEEEMVATFDCVVDIDFTSTTTRKEDREDVMEGLMSDETYISKYNEDPDAEKDRLAKSKFIPLSKKLEMQAANPPGTPEGGGTGEGGGGSE